MTDDDRTQAAIRVLLHDASGQLSLAMLQLGLALEDEALDPAHRQALLEALEACRSAGDSLRAAWQTIDPRQPSQP